jgi:hypothetical protein
LKGSSPTLNDIKVQDDLELLETPSTQSKPEEADMQSKPEAKVDC